MAALLEAEMTLDAHPEELLGAYVVEGCASAAEATTVSRHMAECRTCAAEVDLLDGAVRRLAVSSPRRPAPALRERVLAAALDARPARAVEVAPLLDAYVAQVSKLGRLLAGLSEPQWQLRPTGPHPSVRDLIGHLAANDGMVAEDLDTDEVPRTPDVGRRWREQADVLLREVSRAGPAVLERHVRLAGKAVIRRPLREALTQRAFETWIHADDIRAALHLPAESPPPEQITRIVDFALRLLPGAMDAAGAGHPHQAIRLVLTGPGGGSRQVPLSAASPTAPAGEVVGEVTLSAERFCRLLAGRVTVAEAGAVTRGDPTATAQFLAVAVTMGCD
jgi:uncharacterized protein (TIGR03083 family)